MLGVLVLSAACGSPAAHAPAGESGKAPTLKSAHSATAEPRFGYFEDWGWLLGKALVPSMALELCAHAHPASRAANEKALKDWKIKHSSLISEIESQYEVVRKFAIDTGSTERDAKAFSAKLRESFDGKVRETVRQAYSGNAAERAKKCSAFAKNLLTYEFEVENYPERLRSMRRGPAQD